MVTDKKIKAAKSNVEFLSMYLGTLIQYEHQPAELRKRKEAMEYLATEIFTFIVEVEKGRALRGRNK